MKKLLTSLLALFVLTVGVFGQEVPQEITYQAVATDEDGAELVNTPLTVRVTIVSQTPSGPELWVENHAVNTDEFGLFTLQVGKGLQMGGTLGSFEDIDWGEARRFLRVEMALPPDNVFQLIDTKPMTSVPYALYAETAETALSVEGDDDGDPTNELQDLELNGNELTLSGSDAPPVDLSNVGGDDADANPTNELQSLQLNGSNLTLSNDPTGTTVDLSSLPFDVNDADADPTNELQDADGVPLEDAADNFTAGDVEGALAELANAQNADDDGDPNNEIQDFQLNGSVLTLTGTDGTNGIDLSALPISVADDDADPENELQQLQLNGSNLTLSDDPTGTSVDLSNLPFDVDDADADPSNEIQQLQLNGSNLTLSDDPTGTSVDLSNLPFDIDDADADPTNEIQDADEVALEDVESNFIATDVEGALAELANGQIADADGDPENELQSLQVTGTTIVLTGDPNDGDGNGIDLNNLPLNVDDADADPMNEIQQLSVTGTVLELSGSTQTVDLSTLGLNDPDSDPTNEIQQLVVNGSELSLTDSPSTVDLNNVTFDRDDADADPTNELQELVITGDTIGLTNGNQITLGELFEGAGGFNEPGATITFPQGITNADYIFVPDEYTVPNEKVFYVVAAEDQMRFPGVGNEFGFALTSPKHPMLDEGMMIDNCRCVGFLKDKNNFEPLMIVLDANQGNDYTVPSDMNFVVKSGLDATTPIRLEGQTVNFFSGAPSPIVIPGDVTVVNNGPDEIILTGYLLE